VKSVYEQFKPSIGADIVDEVLVTVK
jgi:hypothetical protein